MHLRQKGSETIRIMRIPPEIIEQVRSSADIVEVVSEYVTLKRRGQNYFGLCPFHSEKTPSFSVHPGKQIFHCFGCGEGGNVITFIMKIEKVSFVEAVQLLARKLNIRIPESREASETEKQKLVLYEVASFASKYFQTNFWSEAGRSARDYMFGRGFSEETLRRFEIGYAPDSWDGLIKAALSKGIKMEHLKAVGLVVPNNRGGFYDRFRDRVIFPIHNLSGLVVGFGGRILQDRPDAPKYINSPETPIYQKSRILYGLWQNKESIRKKEAAILVEGYADVMGLVQAGFRNVVASSGTALTQEQARLLLRYAPLVYVLYDGDLAGANAALRGVDILLQQGLQVKVVMLPEGTDPDSFVRERGAEALYNLLEHAKDLVDFKIEAFLATHSLSSAQERAQLVYLLAETVGLVEDEVTRNLYIQEVAQKLRVPETVVFRAVARTRRRSRHQEKSEPEAPRETLSANLRAERDLLEILLRFPQMIPAVYQNLATEELQLEAHRVILAQIYEQYVNTGSVNPQHVLDYVEQEELQRFIVSAMMREEDDELPENALRQWANDCLRNIKIGNLRRQIEEVRNRMISANAEEMKKLSESYQSLKRRELELRRKEFIPRQE